MKGIAKDINQIFEYMWKDEVTAEVTFNYGTSKVSVKNWDGDILKTPFGHRTSLTISDLEDFFKSRVFPSSRGNKRKMENLLPAMTWSPRPIIRYTHGVMMEDFHWIRFEGEEHLTFEVVRPDLFNNKPNEEIQHGREVPTIGVSPVGKFFLNSACKGNQSKWKMNDKIWVKEDYLGYEGLVENVASMLLEYTNAKELGYDWAKYYVCRIDDQWDERKRIGETKVGCYSPNFLGEGEEFITVADLLELKHGMETLSETFQGFTIKECIEWIVDTVTEMTGVEGFGEWLTFLLEFDQIIMNEDRHFNNIALIRSGTTYKPMPIFDNGLSLFSDTRLDYGIGKTIRECYSKVIAKPFSRDFSKQTMACRELYGRQLKLNITADQVPDDYLSDYKVYDKWILDRVTEVLQNQIRKYPYDKGGN